MSLQTGKDDALLASVRAMVIARQEAKNNMLQNAFGIGYARVGWMLDALEAEGVVGEYNGSLSRQVLAPADGA